MAFQNRMRMGVAQLAALPDAQRGAMLNAFIRQQVKFLETADVVIASLEPEQAVVHLANQPKVQNHIGTIHAAAMALLAETATGMVMGMNTPDHCTLVAKQMNIKYTKPAKGALQAVASLSQEQMSQIQSTDRGEILVPVKLTDEEGKEPLIAEIIWAWFASENRLQQDDKHFLAVKLGEALKRLHTHTQPQWGTFTPQEMVEHLADAIRFSYIKPFEAGKEVSDKQKAFKAFFYSQEPFPHNMNNPLFRDGKPPLRNPDLEAAKQEVSHEVQAFFENFERNPHQTYFHYYAGEMTFADLLRFHAKHLGHHLLQFGLLDEAG